MSKKIILNKSNRKGKRLKVEMLNFPEIKDHIHHFGSDVGQTFIDGATEKQKSGWISRHSVNKNYNNIHSPIFFSRNLLWNTSDLNKNIRLLAKKLDAIIINRI